MRLCWKRHFQRNHVYNQHLSVGDNINGGNGNDTLNIIDVFVTAASVVSLDGIEIVKQTLEGALGRKTLENEILKRANSGAGHNLIQHKVA